MLTRPYYLATLSFMGDTWTPAGECMMPFDPNHAPKMKIRCLTQPPTTDRPVTFYKLLSVLGQTISAVGT